ncbi:hypothetical protein P4H61_21135 [Paenibacillus peoriae]|uniref:hypothetical protein n=1 Tax=Paenibacillus peoriae TaxID=59893 RepID=UPI00026C5679|nr:hypothetical protein [Paenibacillus peoriae]MEC0183997.1 hypothetical protein [Paenibacillus peoriae]
MKSDKKTYWSLNAIISVVVLAWFVLGALAYFIFGNWTDRGTFGDMFGSVNVLFSGLAFATVMYTIHLQKQDLNIQREVQQIQIQDMKMQAQATAKSAEQLEVQQRLMNYQISQDTVLKLIGVKQKMVQEFSWEVPTSGPSSNSYKMALGPEAMSACYISIKRKKGNVTDDKFFKQYFRIFFYTLQLINEADLTDKQKQILADILGIETSDKEIQIIYESHEKEQSKLFLLKHYGFYNQFKSFY